MKSGIRRLIRGLAAMAIALPLISATASTARASASCPPRVIDMGTLGGANSEIDGANRVGDWVGSADNPNGEGRPVLWHDGTILDLGEPDGWAADVTNAGVVVGNTDVDGSNPRAFAWARGTARDLPIPAWADGSFVRRINARDDAAGALYSANGVSVPTVWQRLTHVRVLPMPDGFTNGEGLGINGAGDVVGDVWNENADVAWEWRPDGSNGALQPEYAEGFSQANVVNDRGWAAGGLDFGGQLGLWAAVWRRGTVTKLGQLGEDENFSFAFGQDQTGDYVGGGTYTIDDPYLHVFITHLGLGKLLTMLPLSGDQADSSNAHAAIHAYEGEPGVAVGGASTTSTGDLHATVWTCAYQQAFAPSVTIAARPNFTAPAGPRGLEASLRNGLARSHPVGG